MMTEELYRKISAPFRKSEGCRRILIFGSRFLAGITYVAYPLALIWRALLRDESVGQYVLIPAVSFLVFSIVRSLINAKRPYEIWAIDPILPKNSKGKSFPSRHVFSIFLISMTFLNFSLWLGVVFLVFGLLLAVVRVIAGVHFPRDVIVGAAVGILCGLLYCFI